MKVNAMCQVEEAERIGSKNAELTDIMDIHLTNSTKDEQQTSNWQQQQNYMDRVYSCKVFHFLSRKEFLYIGNLNTSNLLHTGKKLLRYSISIVFCLEKFIKTRISLKTWWWYYYYYYKTRKIPRSNRAKPFRSLNVYTYYLYINKWNLKLLSTVQILHEKW